MMYILFPSGISLALSKCRAEPNWKKIYMILGHWRLIYDYDQCITNPTNGSRVVRYDDFRDSNFMKFRELNKGNQGEPTLCS